MREYRVEDSNVDIKQLESGLMELDSYKRAHEGLVLPCHDIFVQYEGGFC